MPKSKKIDKKVKSKNTKESLSNAKRRLFNTVIMNASATRREVLQQLLNPNKDMNYECGWPSTITISNYKDMFDREGSGYRVTTLLPDESWALPPEIYETEDADETDFEKVLKELEKKRNLLSYLQRIDVLSGIGSFGVLLMGVSDSKKLYQPVAGINEVTGEKIGNVKYELIYLKPFSENVVTVKNTEQNTSSPRYGFPTKYEIEFDSADAVGGMTRRVVHWTRVLHVADNRITSEIFGTPRMKVVWNRLLDIRKVLGGSAEMFWKGAFPGFGLEMDADTDSLTSTQKTELRSEFEDYTQGLQRWLLLRGMKINQLSPQVAEPDTHIEAQKRDIAMTLGCPYRIFIGSEAAHLASDQDIKTWNKRISKRREGYISPFIIRPFLDRLIMYGVLPEIEYFIKWPDLNAPGEKEAADIAKILTEAFAKYVGGDVDSIIPPEEYFKMIIKMNEEQVKAIVEAAGKYGEDLTTKEDEEAEKQATAEKLAADEALARQIEVEKEKAKAKQ